MGQKRAADPSQHEDRRSKACHDSLHRPSSGASSQEHSRSGGEQVELSHVRALPSSIWGRTMSFPSRLSAVASASSSTAPLPTAGSSSSMDPRPALIELPLPIFKEEDDSIFEATFLDSFVHFPLHPERGGEVIVFRGHPEGGTCLWRHGGSTGVTRLS